MTDEITTTEAVVPQVVRWVDELPGKNAGAKKSQKYTAVLAEVRSAGNTNQWAEIEVGAPNNNSASTLAGSLRKENQDLEFASRGTSVFARVKDDDPEWEAQV